MPFTIRLRSCNLEKVTEHRFDPMTGVLLPFTVERGMSDPEKQAVQTLLALAGAVGPNAVGRYHVPVPGDRIEVDFPGLRPGARCPGGTLTAAVPVPKLIELAFTLARTGNLLLEPDGVSRPLTATEEQRLRVIRTLPQVMTVPTAARLWAMVAPPPPPEPGPDTEPGEAPDEPTPLDTEAPPGDGTRRDDDPG